MEVLHERCAGLDVSKKDVKACVQVPGRRPGVFSRTVTTFGSVTAEVLRLRDHLIAERVTCVVMESTGDYWKPFYYLLEDGPFELMLVNAAHVKRVPGRKTDVTDSQWLADLGAHGLVTASFVPPPPIRELRDLTRTRSVLTRDRTREINRLQRVLEDAGIKLSSVASDVTGVSARAMLAALIAGERDPKVLADLAKARLRNKHDQLELALVGRFAEHHGFLVTLHLQAIDRLSAAIDALTSRIEVVIEPFRVQLNQLITIPGVSDQIGQVIIAEIGVDMTQFPTPGQLCSWAGVCPGNNQSAARVKAGHTRPGNRYLKAALGISARGAVNTQDCFLRARFRRVCAHPDRDKNKGHAGKAFVAVEHSQLTAIWHMLSTGEPYHDLGGNYYARRNPEAILRNITRQANNAGYTVRFDPIPTAS